MNDLNNLNLLRHFKHYLHCCPYLPTNYDREGLHIYISDASVIATTYVLYRIALAQGVGLKVFHHIPDTHVLHHLFSTIPHYHALEATRAIKSLL
uniref:Fatty acid desaturase domain-containing protein n=1 Tax=Solanum lycopersicum TaxID=4081 RepID=A0A3Q7JV28_SOLLC